MAEKIGLEAVLNMANFNKGLAQYNSGVASMEKTTASAATGFKGLGNRLSDLTSGMSAAILPVAGVTGAMIALNKAMEFGREGATIAQTQASFDRLMKSMGIAPGILQRMSDATNNTVDDMTLMSSTMTLVAGTSDQLGRAMVEAAPELLNIAKAANKLNPTLGDTSFLYQSLATGIKRSSPLILDNLGLTIKVGEANEKMAAKLGKSVEALSAEEKQMALLEATLAAGNRMIEQVGGSTEAMGDDFAKAQVAMKNMTDQIKVDTYPIIADFVAVAGDLAGALADVYKWLQKIPGGLSILYGGVTLLSREHRKASEEVDETWEMYSKIYAAYPQMYQGAIEATEDFGEAQEEVIVTTDDLAKAQKALDDVIKDIQKSYEDFFGSLASGIVKLRDLGTTATESAQKYEQAVKDLNKKASQDLAEVRQNFEATLPDATTVAERMGMAEDAWDEWGLRIQDIIENGVASPWYQTLQDMGLSKPPDVGIKEWAQDLKEQFYQGQLPDLLPPEWAANVKAQQEEATRIVQAENAKRRAEVEKARQEELAAEQEARNQATLELALTLAEQSGLLQAWSQQRFGPNFGQVADTAKEVLGLLQSGMLDIDADLQSIITNTTTGVQQALDTTGGLAEENKQLLDGILSTDWVAEKKKNIIDTLSPENLPTNEFFQRAQEMWQGVDEGLPDTPWDFLIDGFDGAASSIITQATLMGLDLGKDFDQIDIKWAAMVQSQVTSWDEGMTDVEKAIQEKVIEKLAEIPTKIVVTVTTEQEGGGTTEGKQHGGSTPAGVPVVVGEGGPELFVPEQPGTVIPNWRMSVPALLGGAGSGAGGGTGGTPVQITMNPVINNQMDLAEFQAVTLQTVQRALRGV